MSAQTAPIRRTVAYLEETQWEGWLPVDPPRRRVVVAAVIENPFAGRHVDDLTLLMDTGAVLGEAFTRRALALLAPDAIESFGKGAIVGMAGEIEHAAALLHPSLGAPVRELLGGGKALIPSAKKRGGPGTPIDVPLNHKDAARVRSHFDAIEIRVPDAPGDDEIVVAVAFSVGGRPHPRVGGLRLEDVKGEDGLT